MSRRSSDNSQKKKSQELIEITIEQFAYLLWEHSIFKSNLKSRESLKNRQEGGFL